MKIKNWHFYCINTDCRHGNFFLKGTGHRLDANPVPWVEHALVLCTQRQLIHLVFLATG